MRILICALFTAVTLLPALAAAAPPACGSSISGNFVLDGDMICAETNGLIVAGDNTTIDLNGHSIQCTGAGLSGSCQKIVGGPTGIPANSYSGILSNGKSNVRISGPGTVDGFGIGVHLIAGDGLKVQDVTVTGPAQPDAATNQRLIANGIQIVNTTCPSPAENVAIIDGNEVLNQRFGVILQNAECVKISDNYVHDNNSRFGDAHGVDLIDSRNNLVMKNIIERNGANRIIGDVSDSGIQLVNGSPSGDTSGNQIHGNSVSDNCGDGIAAVVGANNNSVIKNVARFNSDSTLGGQCLPASPGQFFDLAERGAGAGNVWNPNNQCRTSSATIPVGVCGPAE